MKKIITLQLFIWCSTLLYAQSYQWEPVGSGITCSDAVDHKYFFGRLPDIQCMVVDTINQVLYAGGKFDTIGGNYSLGIGFWDGSNWNVMPTNPGGITTKTIMYKGLLVTATLDTINGYYQESEINIWNGKTWHTIASFLKHGDPKYFEIYNGDLIVGGNFDTIIWHDSFQNQYTLITHNIARWDGTNWYPLNAGLKHIENGKGGKSGIYCMEVYRGELYCGGRFESLDPLESHNIARWDGNQWKQVGGNGASGSLWASVSSMKKIKDRLYVLGDFDSISGENYGGLTFWDGDKWHPFNNNEKIGTLNNINDSLYITGKGNCIWKADSGVSYKFGLESKNGRHPYGIISYQGEMYAYGCFDTIDGQVFNHVARLVNMNGIIKHDRQEQIQLYPNPASDNLSILSSFKQIEIKDLYGRQIFQQIVTDKQTTIDVSYLSAGIYFAVLKSEDGSVTVRKFVKE